MQWKALNRHLAVDRQLPLPVVSLSANSREGFYYSCLVLAKRLPDGYDFFKP